jgi:hypothetical protein
MTHVSLYPLTQTTLTDGILGLGIKSVQYLVPPTLAPVFGTLRRHRSSTSSAVATETPPLTTPLADGYRKATGKHLVCPERFWGWLTNHGRQTQNQWSCG